MKVLVINGPNINLVGRREPSIYGVQSVEKYCQQLKSEYSHIDISYFQSNIEGELIDKIHEVGFSYDGIILNAGAYTHTSIAILDAIRAVSTPIIEVHISNTQAREPYRHHSMIAAGCIGVIGGFGLKSYKLALEALIDQ